MTFIDGSINSLDDMMFSTKRELIEQITDKFYERIKEKPDDVLLAYEKIVRPSGSRDFFCVGDDLKRLGRWSAVQKVLLERKIDYLE